MLPRFNNILVPVDLGERTLHSVDVAFEIAEANKARVTLLHVIESIDSLDDEELGTFYQQLTTRAEESLDRLVQRFVDAGLAAEYRIRRGRRLDEILAFAEDRKIDLIVLSSHRVDPEQPVKSFGTLSYQISVLCACPVLLVKET